MHAGAGEPQHVPAGSVLRSSSPCSRLFDRLNLMSAEDKVLSYGDFVLRTEDLELLNGHNWLNDTLIGFYFEYLEDQEDDDNFEDDGSVGGRGGRKCKFVGPAVTQLLKLLPSDQVGDVLQDVAMSLREKTYEYWFFAVNDSTDPEKESGGTHWSLLVYSKIDKKFVAFDSMSKSNDGDAKIIVKKLRQFTENAEFTNNHMVKKQDNGYDCGCHLLRNAELISEYVRSTPNASLLTIECPSATPTEAGEMRNRILQVIENLIENENDKKRIEDLNKLSL